MCGGIYYDRFEETFNTHILLKLAGGEIYSIWQCYFERQQKINTSKLFRK